MRIFTKSRILLLAILIFLVTGSGKTASAEDIILKDLNNSPVNLSQYRGRPAILFFWTTWCHFCRNGIKVLNQNYNEMEKEGIIVFAINVSEPEYNVRRFLKNYPINFRVLLDKDGLAANRYGIIGVPTYIFLDKSGRIIVTETSLPTDYKNLLLE